MIHILNKENTILNKFLSQIRDKEVQQDSMRFRRNIERIGEIMSYEISKTLNYKSRVVETPLGEAVVEDNEKVLDKIDVAAFYAKYVQLQQNAYAAMMQG